MSQDDTLYRVQFISNGERYELYVKTLIQGALFGFVEIGEFVWDTHTSVVVDPSHERLKSEFSDVKKKGSAKITKLENKSDKVATFPSPIYTPTKE